MVLYNVPNANVPRRAFSSITPFTYPDGITHLELLEKLRYYATVTLPESIEKTLGEFDADITERLQAVIADVIARLETQTEWVEGEISSLTQYVNDAVESIINSTIEVSDPVISGVLNNDDSLSARAVRDLSAPLTLWVDDYKQSGDASDSESWQRAVDIARATDATQTRIVGRKTAYEFHVPVNIDGLANCHLSGSLNAKARISARQGAGVVAGAFLSTAAGDAPTDNPTIFAAGDSRTADDNWLITLASYANTTVIDGGLAGQSATEIAFRLGALAVGATFADNAILPTGETEITTLTPEDDWRPNVGASRTLNVSVTASDGTVIPGKFRFASADAPTYGFTPDNPLESSVIVPGNAPLTVLADEAGKSGIGHEDDLIVVWIGRNSVGNMDALMRAHNAIRDKFPNTFTIGDVNGSNEPVNSENYNFIVEANRQVAALYGDRFYDPRQWFIREAIYAIGATPNDDDRAKMANDCPPLAIMSDNIHFSPETSMEFGVPLFTAMRASGVIAGTTGEPTSNVTFTNFEFNGSMTGVPDEGLHDRYQDRAWGNDYLSTAIRMRGDGVPTSPTNRKVDGVTIRDCDFIGMYTLPILLMGVSNFKIVDNYFWRCLDVGFTFSKNGDVSSNSVMWSADNGLSVSRGCHNVTVSNNLIEGSYYSGIHCGGWAGDFGPTNIIVSGNNILNSRMYGISADDGGRELKISNNGIDGVRRGGQSTSNRDYMVDGAPALYGTGIMVRGMLISGGGTRNPVYGSYIDSVEISGNTVANADRMGIIVGGGASDVKIGPNKVTNIGSAFNANGTVEISPTHKYYNIGVGIYELHSTTVTDVTVAGNVMNDTRATNLMNYAVMIDATNTSHRQLANSARRTRNTYYSGITGNRWRVGDEAAGGAIAELATGNSSVASLLYSTAGENQWAIRKTTTGGLEIYSYTADISVPLRFSSSTGEAFLNIPEISGVEPNLYITQSGALRRIVSA